MDGSPGSSPAGVALPDVLASMHVVSVPLRVRFRGVTHREAVLVEGPSGWGEFAPFLEYDDATAAPWLAAALESAYAAWPAPERAEVPVNATVPAVAAAEVPGVLARFDACRAVKVKVAERGQTLADDLDRVAAVRAIVGPGVPVRVDANAAWGVDDALEAVRALAAYGLEYVEQPCASVPELAELRLALARAGLDVPVAADESIRRSSDPLRVAREGAADLVIVKVAPLGGVARALEIVNACGLPAVVSSAIDTSVGIAAGVALAAALPSLEHACGLGTVALLEGDVAREPLVARGGLLEAGRVDADPELLDRWAASPERREWWRERLGRTWALLGRAPSV